MNIIQERDLAEALRAGKSEIAAAIEQAIVDHTEDDVLGDGFRQRVHSKVETAAKSMVDGLITQLETEGGGGQAADGDNNSGGDTGSSEDTYWLRISEPDSDTDRFETTAEYQSDLMAATVSYLIKHESLVGRLGPLPCIPGDTRAILNDDPTYNGTEMAQHRAIAGEYYLEVNLNWSQKQRELTRMADACDVIVEFRRLNDEISGSGTS